MLRTYFNLWLKFLNTRGRNLRRHATIMLPENLLFLSLGLAPCFEPLEILVSGLTSDMPRIGYYIRDWKISKGRQTDYDAEIMPQWCGPDDARCRAEPPSLEVEAGSVDFQAEFKAIKSLWVLVADYMGGLSASIGHHRALHNIATPMSAPTWSHFISRAARL